MTKILVIEDNAKHLEDAKEVARKAMENGSVGQVDFATTYVEAKQLMSSEKYDGIITDIFFPYDENGRSNEMAENCNELLWFDKVEMSSMLDRRPECRSALLDWLRGSEMHPTGIVVVTEAKKDDISAVFCTDTYHHGYATEPVNMWARKNGITMIDCCPDDSNAHAAEKDWSRAFESVLAKIKTNEDRLARELEVLPHGESPYGET